MPDKVRPPTLSRPARLAPYATLGAFGLLGNPYLSGFAGSPLAGAQLAVIDLATVTTPFLPVPTPSATPAPVVIESQGGGDVGVGVGIADIGGPDGPGDSGPSGGGDSGPAGSGEGGGAY